MKHLLIGAAGAALLAVPCAVAERSAVTIDPSRRYQEIDHFTASDAWSGAFVGRYFEEAQKGQLARWLFSQEIGADGNPEGIGLSMWRVNLGGGTLEQDGANIMPIQRRAESYLTKDGRAYDWNKCIGHRYFMEKAREYGCNKFLFFSNTPLVQWTRNGQGYGEKNDPAANIRPDCYGKFADYLAEVSKHFQERGFNIAYVSPINEPQVNWDSNRQEGTRWLVPEMHKMYVELDRALTERKLDGVKMLLGEASNILNIYEEKNGEESPYGLARKFFDPASPWSVRDLKHMPPLIGGHSYWTEKNPIVLRETRERLADCCKKYGIDYQQTEWCLLVNKTPTTYAGFTADWACGPNADIQVGLLLGRLIYSDLVYANAKAWGYWKATETNGVYALTAVSTKSADFTQGGTVKANKLLWALGNFSLFVRPQYRRVALDGAGDLEKTAGVAFLSPDDKRLVAVLVNSDFKENAIKIGLPRSYADRVVRARAFRTDAQMDLGGLKADGNEDFTLAPRSLTTVVYDFK